MKLSWIASLGPSVSVWASLLCIVPQISGAQASVETASAYRWVLTDLNRLPSEEVTWLVEDDLQNRYFATRKGLTVEDKNDNFRIHTRASTRGGLGSDSLTCLALDRYRDLWVGTDGGGLSVLSGSAWRNYTKENTRLGLPDNGVLGVALYKEERWVATRNGFAVLRGSAWTTYTGDRISGRLPHPAVTSIAVDSVGDKWLGTLGGLVRLSGSVWTRFNVESAERGLPHNGITALLVDSRNAVWVGTQAGLARRDPNGEWLRLAPESGLRGLATERVSSISQGPSGEIWVTFRGGAARYFSGRWELFTRENVPGLLTLYVNYAMGGAQGQVRIATQKGVIARLPVSVIRDGDE